MATTARDEKLDPSLKKFMDQVTEMSAQAYVWTSDGIEAFKRGGFYSQIGKPSAGHQVTKEQLLEIAKIYKVDGKSPRDQLEHAKQQMLQKSEGGRAMMEAGRYQPAAEAIAAACAKISPLEDVRGYMKAGLLPVLGPAIEDLLHHTWDSGELQKKLRALKEKADQESQNQRMHRRGQEAGNSPHQDRRSRHASGGSNGDRNSPTGDDDNRRSRRRGESDAKDDPNASKGRRRLQSDSPSQDGHGRKNKSESPNQDQGRGHRRGNQNSPTQDPGRGHGRNGQGRNSPVQDGHRRRDRVGSSQKNQEPDNEEEEEEEPDGFDPLIWLSERLAKSAVGPPDRYRSEIEQRIKLKLQDEDAAILEEGEEEEKAREAAEAAAAA